jgi:hypothetical protein
VRDNSTWRPGAISQYDSRWCIAQKFCLLNRITLHDLANELGVCDSTGVKPLVWLERVPKELFVSRMPENGHRLRIHGIAEYLPYLRAPDRFWAWQLDKSYTMLRFCLTCLRHGFHSPVHQLPYLERCVLHDEALLHECPMCGAGIHSAKWFVCTCGFEYWPGGFGRNWYDWQNLDLGPISQYLDWLSSIDPAPSFPTGLSFLEVGWGGAWDRSVGSYLAFAAAYCPAPASIKKVFAATNIRIVRLQVAAADAEVVDLMRTREPLGAKLGLLLAMPFCANVTSGVDGVMRSVARRLIRIITAGHKKCLSRGVQLIVDGAGTHDWRGHSERLGPICPSLGVSATLAENVLTQRRRKSLLRHLGEQLDPRELGVAAQKLDVGGAAETAFKLHPAVERVAGLYWTHAVVGLAIEELDYWNAYSAGSDNDVRRTERCGPLLCIRPSGASTMEVLVGMPGFGNPYIRAEHSHPGD